MSTSTSRRTAAGKILALIASITMVTAGMIAAASPASAAAPDQCPAGYTYNAGTGQCDGVQTTPAVPSDTADGYVCAEGTLVNTNECSIPVDPTAVYACPEHYTTTDNPVKQNSVCTKTGTWTWDDDEWECSADDDVTTSSTTSDVTPTESCEKTKKAEFVKWTCPTVVDDSPRSIAYKGEDGKEGKDHKRGKDHAWHKGSKDCGDDEEVTPTCDPLIVPATPVYPYVCPATYSSTDKTITSETVCSRAVTAEPTCPDGTVYEAGQCNTPAGPTPQSNEPVVAAALVEPPAQEPVAAPDAAPDAVAVPAPAQVAAPAKVSAPAAATVPASVPAGDGSKAPSLPLWAFALVAVGLAGAAFTGGQLLGARK